MHAQSLPGVDATRTGLLGFSLGGYLCLRVRRTCQALVEFFAPILDDLGTGPVSLQLQIHHGKRDNLVGFEANANRIDLALRSTGAVTELCGYDGAGHGFVGNDPANANARALSKSRAIAFFEAHL